VRASLLQKRQYERGCAADAEVCTFVSNQLHTGSISGASCVAFSYVAIRASGHVAQARKETVA
jgi:hypothetical protein